MLLTPLDDKSKLNRMSWVTWLFKSGVHHYVLNWKFCEAVTVRRTRGSDALQRICAIMNGKVWTSALKVERIKSYFILQKYVQYQWFWVDFLTALTSDQILLGSNNSAVEFELKSVWTPNFGTIRKFWYVLYHIECVAHSSTLNLRMAN